MLTLFAEAATQIQSENKLSISLIAPTMLQIYYDLLHEQPNILYAKSLSNSLLNSLISRVSDLLEELITCYYG